jgi:hypothetical protein
MARTKLTKVNQVRDLVEEQACWSGGIEHTWKGSALVSPWLLERLVSLASYAPQAEIDRLKKACDS